MKLLTKRLLAVAMVIAMTFGMAMSAMAISNIDDAKLSAVGLDPAKSEIVYGWVEIKDASGANGASKQAGVVYVTAGADGSYTMKMTSNNTYFLGAIIGYNHDFTGGFKLTDSDKTKLSDAYGLKFN